MGGGEAENCAPDYAAGIAGSGPDGESADAPGIQLCYEPDYANADVAIRSHLASGALLEVSEDGDHGIDFCLALCAWLREVTPHCRLMLMCPEGQPEREPRHRG